MKVKHFAVVPFLVFVDPIDSIRRNVLQGDGPDGATQGYVIIKNRGDDFPHQILEGKDLDDVVAAAQALADSVGVPLYRQEWLKKLRPQIVSVQVVPYIDNPESAGVQTQLTGPTAETTGWGVYLRQSGGSVMWVADSTETEARFIGELYAKHHGVAIEPQPWVKESA